MKKIFLCWFCLQFNLSLAQKNIQTKMTNLASIEARHGTIFKSNYSKIHPFHRLIMEPIFLGSKIQNANQLEEILYNFNEENSLSFGIDPKQIKLKSIQKGNNIWYAHFVQTIDNIEVLDSEITYRVHANGNLIMLGIDYFPDNQINTTSGKEDNNLAQIISKKYKSSYYKIVERGAEIYFQPVIKGEECKLAKVKLFEGKRINGETDLLLVDIYSGIITRQISKTHYGTIHGKVSGKILPRIATEAQVKESFPHLSVMVADKQIYSNSSGDYMIEFEGSMPAILGKLKGKYVNVINFNGQDATNSTIANIEGESVLHFDNSNSTLAERNVYYHINVLHDHNKLIDPDFTALDYPLQCVVNDNAAFCNAYWNGTNLHFNTQNNTCAMNSAFGASVIYHEYGHAINDRLYYSLGAPFGMQNPSIHEAFSDIYATLFLNDSRFALGWYGPGTMTRNLNNAKKYPNDIVGQQHSDGLILGGAFWDLGKLISPEKAYKLAHFVKYGLPDDSDIAVVFADIYLETIIADDDDGNLMNGTPHSAEIEQAFCKHGIGSDLFVTRRLDHTPVANIVESGEIIKLYVSIPDYPNFLQSADNIKLVYSLDDFKSFIELEVSSVENNLYEVEIPAQSEAELVKYYFKIDNNPCGNQLLYPSRDFKNENFSFLVGDYDEIFYDNFENENNWQLNTFGDNATSGRWQRANPQEVIDGLGFLLSPDKGHSIEGNLCLVTGAGRGTFWYSNDVDGGKTTVTSPVFENLDESSVFSFYKWFVHGAEFVFPAQGEWKLEVTDDDNFWKTIEMTNYGDHRHWIKAMYRFSDYVDVTKSVRVRFVASDFGSGSIVEALVDDFSIYNLNMNTAVSDFQEPQISIYPNPATDYIHCQFDETYRIYWIEIFNPAGQKVLGNISQLDLEASINISTLKPGLYYIILSTDKGSLVQKFIKTE